MTNNSTAWAAARETRADGGHETRASVLDAAANVFGSLGYARTTVAGITEAAGVSRPAFYAYFASKEVVFVEVAGRTRDAFLAAHELPEVDESDPYALGRASVEGFLTAYMDNYDLLTVIEHQAIADKTIAKIWAEIQERPVRRAARYIDRLVEEGSANPAADPAFVAEAIMGMISRFAQKDRGKAAVLEERVEALTDVWLRLIGATGY